MYTVSIPHNRYNQTDEAIEAYLAANEHTCVDEAVDAIFQIGVSVMLALKKTEPVFTTGARATQQEATHP